MQNIPSIKKAVWLILSGIGIGFLVSIILMIILAAPTDVRKIQLILLVGELFMIIPILLWGSRQRLSIVELLRFHLLPAPATVATVPIALGLTIIVDALDHLAQKIFPPPEQLARIGELLKITDWRSALLVIGIVVIIAPLVEELLFRGFLQRVLEYRLGDITRAVLISALVFALMHFNIWWVVQIYVLGVFMGYLAWRTNSVWPSFIIHACNNGWSIVLTHFDSSLPWYTWHDQVHPVVIILGLLLLLGGLQLIKTVPVRTVYSAYNDQDALYP